MRYPVPQGCRSFPCFEFLFYLAEHFFEFLFLLTIIFIYRNKSDKFSSFFSIFEFHDRFGVTFNCFEFISCLAIQDWQILLPSSIVLNLIFFQWEQCLGYLFCLAHWQKTFSFILLLNFILFSWTIFWIYFLFSGTKL